jgi:hypothetical protein
MLALEDDISPSITDGLKAPPAFKPALGAYYWDLTSLIIDK